MLSRVFNRWQSSSVFPWPSEQEVSSANALITKESLHNSYHTETPDTDRDKYSKVWARMRGKLRGCILLSLKCKELRIYGSSTMHFTDGEITNTRSLQQILEGLESKRKIDTVDEAPLPRFIMHPSCNFKNFWNGVMVILLIYTATIMPYRMAYIDDRHVGDWEYVELAINLLFFIDIPINFFSAYEEPDGTIVGNRRRICVNYLRTWFCLDVIACFPFDYFNSDDEDSSSSYNGLVRILRLPRLYRLFRLSRILKLIKTSKNSEFFEKLQDILQLNTALVRIVSFMITVLIVVHLSGCFWFLLAKIEGFVPDSWVVRMDLLDSSSGEQYIASIYWAFTTISTVGYGDIVPKTQAERVFGIIWMMLGVGFYSFTIGSLTSILSNIDSTNIELTLKLNAIDQISKEAKLKPYLTRKLRLAVKLHAKKTELDTSDKQGMFEALPKRLRYELAKQMYDSVSDKLPFFFNRSPEFVSTIIPALKCMIVEHDELIYSELDDSDEIYILSKGRVDFLVSFSSTPFLTMLEGSYFGEVELFNKEKRYNSARAFTETELLIMDRNSISLVEDYFPDIATEMHKIADLRKEHLVKEKAKVKKALDSMNFKRKLGRARAVYIPLNSSERVDTNEILPLLIQKERC